MNFVKLSLNLRSLALGLSLTVLSHLMAVPAMAMHFCDRARTLAGVEYKWCVDTEDKRGDNRQLIYFLHGAGGNENVWGNSPGYRRAQAIWASQPGKAVPVVISISFGQLWLLTDVPRDNNRTLHATLVQEVIPTIEAKYQIQNPTRSLIGESMGGFNATQLLMKDAGMFEKVALVCPALPTIGPYSIEQDVTAYIGRHKPYVRVDWIRNIMALTRHEFPTEPDWKAHDPFTLINKLSFKASKIFVSCTRQDEHGFYEGSELFAREAQKRGIYAQWVPINQGGHCYQTEESIGTLANFLAIP